MKVVLTAANLWCLNHNLTENKIYDLIEDSETKLEYPNFWILNDINVKINAPMHCFDSLKTLRKLKLKKIYNGEI